MNGIQQGTTVENKNPDALLIAFAGLPGVGKTEIARELARQLHGVYLRIDSIEQALRGSGVQPPEAGYCVAYRVAEDNLRLGRIVITDCVNPLAITRVAWRETARSAGARLVEIEVRCSNQEEHRRRVESRVNDIPGLHLPSWNDVLTRDYEVWDREHVVIDTAWANAEECVSALLGILGEAGGRAEM